MAVLVVCAILHRGVTQRVEVGIDLGAVFFNGELSNCVTMANYLKCLFTGDII